VAGKCKGFTVTTPTKHLLSTVAVRAHALRTASPLCMEKGLTRCLFLLHPAELGVPGKRG